MLYSIGYQRLTVPRLREILEIVKAQALIDVRSVPMSRKSGFGRRQLEEAFPKHYRWEGHWLGGVKPGRPGTTSEGLEWLAGTQPRWRAVLLCVCEAPGQCHKHVLIAKQLLALYRIDVSHIYQDHIVLASELERSILEDDDYEYESFPPEA